MLLQSLKVSTAALLVLAASGLGSQPVVAQAPAGQKPAAAAPASQVPKEFLTKPPSITRKVVGQQEVGDFVLTVAVVDVPVGGREGRHRHDGILIGLVEEGVLSMDHEPTGVRDYKPGETFYIPEGQIHEGFNRGTVPTKVVGSFVIRKGQPMAVPMPLPGQK
jgi:quercetin dioxygenase-like cupin family protein